MSAREPLAIRAAIVAAVTAVVHVAVVMGWLGITEAQETTIAGAVDMIGTVVLVVWSRGAVTPTADPRNDAGDPLVSAYTGEHRP